MINILVYLLVFTLPLENLQIPLNGLEVRLHQLLFIALGLVYSAKILSQISIPNLRSNLLDINWYYKHIYLILLGLIWVMITLGGILFGQDLALSLIRSGVLLGYIGVFQIIYHFLSNKQKLSNLIQVIYFTTAILLLIGLYEAITFQLNIYSFQVFPGRVDSLLPEPNWFAMWLTFVYAISLPLVYYAKTFKEELLVWAMILGTSLMVILSVTRASWLAIIFISLSYLVYHSLFVRQYWKLVKFIIVLGSVIFGAIGMSQLGLTDFNLQDRLESLITRQTTYYSILDETTQQEIAVDPNSSDSKSSALIIRNREDVNVISRLEGYNQALAMVRDHLLTGVGLAGYENRIGKGYNSNNIFLAVAVAGGVISLAIFMTLLYIIIKQAVLIHSLDAKLSTIILASLASILITGMFNDNFLMGFIWLILAISAKIPEIVWQEEDSR